MVQYWSIDGGRLTVWTHMHDPNGDDPVGSTDEWSQTWDSYPEEAERLIEQWLKDQGIANDIGYQDVTRILIDLRAGEFEQV